MKDNKSRKWTGFKDVNNKKILIGDIVVKIDEPGRWLKIEVKDDTPLWSFFDTRDPEEIPKKFEIIGNIYENEDLKEELKKLFRSHGCFVCDKFLPHEIKEMDKDKYILICCVCENTFMSDKKSLLNSWGWK